MHSEREADALEHIGHHLELIKSFIGNVNYETFQSDLLRIYAVTRCLEVISEASRRLTPELKARHPGIAWRDMAAAGNVYRHDYEDVVTQQVWKTVQNELPALRDVIERELGPVSK